MLHPSIGFAITDYPTSMVTNAIMLDADVVVGAGLGAAMLIAYNGVAPQHFHTTIAFALQLHTVVPSKI